MKNNPVDSIGILSQSMMSVDTTAGFTNILNLGLNGALTKQNEKQMEEYTNALGVMKNLQVIDILNGIIDGFNKQLLKANKSVYDGVQDNIRNNETFAGAPFNRKDGENRWDIRVCTASNLTGDKYTTRDFTDYSNYLNSTVFLKPIKGLGGTTIDFTQTSTYSKLDSGDLDTYVGLESEWLSRSIEDVFKEGGTFSGHQQVEYTRLYEEFGKYYGQWMAGEALKNAGFYAKPMFPHGPNMLQAASIAASMTGQVWLAVLVSAATSAIQVADGTMSWRQAGFQVGMSIAAAGIGAGAGQLGNMAGATGSLANVAVKATASTIGNTLLNSVKLDGNGLTVDRDSLKSARTWTSAGINIATAIIGDQYCSNDFSKTLVNGVGNGLSGGVLTGNWKESMENGMRNSVAGYFANKAGGVISSTTGLSGGALNNVLDYGMKQMLGGNDKFSWGMVSQNNAIGDYVGQYLNNAFGPTAAETAAKKREDIKKMGFTEEEANEIIRNNDDLAGKQQRDTDRLGFLDRLDVAVGGMFQSMKNDMLNTTGDFSRAANDIGKGLGYAVTALGNVAERTGNLLTKGSFASDDEIAQIREKEMIQERIREQENRSYTVGNNDELEGLIALNGKEVPIGNGFMKKDSQMSEAEFNAAMDRGNVPKEQREKIRKSLFPDKSSIKENAENNGSQGEIKTRQGEIVGENTVFPLSGTLKDLVARITSIFGSERDYTNTQGEQKHDTHKGVDVGTEDGTPIIAPADGKVSFTKDYGDEKYGKLTVIDHGNGIETFYGHQSDILVKPGQVIRRGDRIGSTGNTGNTTGSHLHYEIRRYGKPVNPINFGW